MAKRPGPGLWETTRGNVVAGEDSISAAIHNNVVSFEIELQTSRETPLSIGRFALVFSSFQIETTIILRLVLAGALLRLQVVPRRVEKEWIHLTPPPKALH